jgi:hypothetical protein
MGPLPSYKIAMQPNQLERIERYTLVTVQIGDFEFAQVPWFIFRLSKNLRSSLDDVADAAGNEKRDARGRAGFFGDCSGSGSIVSLADRAGVFALWDRSVDGHGEKWSECVGELFGNRGDREVGRRKGLG